MYLPIQRHVILPDKTKGTNFLYKGTMAFICKYVLVMYCVEVFCRFNTIGSSLAWLNIDYSAHFSSKYKKKHVKYFNE